MSQLRDRRRSQTAATGSFWLFLSCCSRRVIPVAGLGLEAFVRYVDSNFSIRAVGPRVAGPVGNPVLGPQLLADVLETDRKVLNLEWEERLAARLFRELLQRLVAAILFLGTKIGSGIRADAVNRDEVLLRHFQSFCQRCPAGIIVAVADKYQHTSSRLIGQLFVHAKIDCIVKRGTASGANLADGVGKFFGIIRKILKEVHTGIEADDERLVFSSPERGIEEFDRGFLLESQLVPDTTARVHQKRNRQWKVGFAAEIRDGLYFLVFKNLEVVFLQARVELSLLVGDADEKVHQIDVDRNRLVPFRLRGLLALGCWDRRGCSSLGRHGGDKREHQNYDPKPVHRASIITSRGMLAHQGFPRQDPAPFQAWNLDRGRQAQNSFSC